MVPFWTALIPPMGISCLKSFLEKHGYAVTALDLNTDMQFREIYDLYFERLKEHIPANRQGNFYNIGVDVLQNHLLAYINREPGRAYTDLVNLIIDRTFFTQVQEPLIEELDGLLQTFFDRLDRHLTRLLEVEKPDVLGLSVFKGVLPAALYAFKQTRRTFPHIRTVMGGGIFADQLAPGSPNFELFLAQTPYIDHIIIGEGELLFLKLLTGELPVNQRVFTARDTGGEVLDLAHAPLPDFSDLELQYYPNLAAYASRSCPFQCTFCSETVNWGRYRKKTARRVREELKQLSERENYQLFLLSDSLLNPIMYDLSREMIAAGLSLYWDGYVRVDKSLCLEDNTLLLRRGGCYRARLGIESGSDQVLELMNKKITPEQIKAAVSSLARAGIKTTTYWVIGHPGETEADFNQSLVMLAELKDYIYEVDCNPFRFYYSGQVNSGEWRKGRVALLYPEEATKMLLLQTWMLEGGEPSREETYNRLFRFVEHCRKLGIPNPYTWKEIAAADERWSELHKNAVPRLLDFREKGRFIDENLHIVKQYAAQDTVQENGDFAF